MRPKSTDEPRFVVAVGGGWWPTGALTGPDDPWVVHAPEALRDQAANWRDPVATRYPVIDHDDVVTA